MGVTDSGRYTRDVTGRPARSDVSKSAYGSRVNVAEGGGDDAVHAEEEKGSAKLAHEQHHSLQARGSQRQKRRGSAAKSPNGVGSCVSAGVLLRSVRQSAHRRLAHWQRV